MKTKKLYLCILSLIAFVFLTGVQLLNAQEFENDSVEMINTTSSGMSVKILAQRTPLKKTDMLYKIYNGETESNVKDSAGYTPAFVMSFLLVEVDGKAVFIPKNAFLLFDPNRMKFEPQGKNKFRIIFECADGYESYYGSLFFDGGVLIMKTITPFGCDKPTQKILYSECGIG